MDGTKQVAQWEPESYLNAGPARLPSIRKTILGYCRELGVPLEVEVNSSRSVRLMNEKPFDLKEPSVGDFGPLRQVVTLPTITT